MKIRILVMALIALLGSAVGVVMTTSTATADHCEGHTGGDDSGTDLEVNCPPEDDNPPGDDDPPGDDGGGDGGGGGGWTAEDVCAEQAPGWATCVTVVQLNGIQPNDMCGYVLHEDQSRDTLLYYHPDAPEDAVLMYNICPRDGGPYYTEDTQWVPGGAAPQPPTPAEVAEELWGHVQGRLDNPVVDAFPADGTTAILNIPTFVVVNNWQGPITEHGDAGGIGVTLTATPSLSFEPGEPGAGRITCTPPGTRYDPQQDPRELAGTPGACAYAYTQRTDVGSRPAAWPGQVLVTWTAHWEADNGETDDFDPVVLDDDVPRAVTEVQAVVVDSD